MEERLRLTEEKKAQLLMRVQEALDNDILDKTDWLKIYDILLEATHREATAVYEEMLNESINGGDEEC